MLFINKEIKKSELGRKIRKDKFSNLHEQTMYIHKILNNQTLTSSFEKLYLIMPSMDAGVFKNDEFQEYLSKLVTHERIALIASVDHIYSSTIWNETALKNFNFVFFQVDTFEGFDLEKDYQ